MRLDSKGARARLAEARAARERGDVRAARVALTEALGLHPPLRGAYDELGAMLSEIGLDEAAERCFRGELPEVVVREWFGERCETRPPGRIEEHSAPFTSALGPHAVQRHPCHAPRTRELAPPGGIAPPLDRMFGLRQMTSGLAFVDRVHEGSLWFDGFSRAVFDDEGRLIDHHTRGSPELVRSRTRGARPCRVEGRAFVVANRGNGNYYHWMFDILPSFALFAKAGYTFEADDRIVVLGAASRFHKATLARLGFGSERIIELERTSPWLQARELVAPFYMNAMAKKMGDWVPAFLRETFLVEPDSADGQGARGTGVPSTPARLYLARSGEARNARSIANEAEMIAFLEHRGFVTVYPETLDVEAQARLLAGAETVLAPHGAALANIVFCSPGTTVIELYGTYMETCYWALSELCELDYHNHRCGHDPHSISFHQRSHQEHNALRRRGFSVDLAELGALLDAASVH